MRFAILISLLAATPAMACNTDFISVQDWQVQNIERSGMSGPYATISYRLNADRSVRMIDASIRFEDALGGSMGTLSVDRDVRLSPGEVATLEGFYPGASSIARIPNVDPADVQVTTCTRAVVFHDGTVQRFNE